MLTRTQYEGYITLIDNTESASIECSFKWYRSMLGQTAFDSQVK